MSQIAKRGLYSNQRDKANVVGLCFLIFCRVSKKVTAICFGDEIQFMELQ